MIFDVIVVGGVGHVLASYVRKHAAAACHSLTGGQFQWAHRKEVSRRELLLPTRANTCQHPIHETVLATLSTTGQA